MKKQHLVLLGVLALGLTTSGTASADMVLTSVQIGPQTPVAVCRGSSASCVVALTRTGNGNMDIYLKAQGLANDVTAAFYPNPVRFSGSGTSMSSTMILSTASSTLPGPHAFSVTATDGGSHKTLATAGNLEVTMCSAGIAPRSDCGMCFAFASVPGQSYKIQATTNLFSAEWTTLCTTNSGTSSLLVFVDRDTPRYPSRLYRTVPQ